MDDKELLDKIKKSAENVDIPESLQPEEIEKKLEAEKKRRKFVFLRRYGGIAAAAVLLLTVGLGVWPMIRQEKAADNTVKQEAQAGTKAAAAAEESVQAEPELAADVGAAQDASNAEESVQTEPELAAESADTAAAAGAAVLRAENYDELYEMLSQYPSNQLAENGIAAYGTQIAETEIAADTSASSAGTGAAGSSGTALQPESSGQEGYSTTNTQEKNVDEADIVKTDGTYIYAMDTEGTVRIVEAKTMKLVSEIPFDGKQDAFKQEMYVNGDVLQLISTEYEYVTSQGDLEELDGVRTYYSIPKNVTIVTTYDISAKNAPEKIGTYRQEGRYLTSRRNGDYLYLFTSYTPDTRYGVDAREYYVPKAGDGYIPCGRIFLPSKERGGHYGGADYLVGGSVKDTAASEPADRMAVVSGGSTFYVSRENIYSATPGWEENRDYTEIVRLGYEDGIFTAGSCGRVPGTLNDNFSMDEYEGNLRVVTTLSVQREVTKGEAVYAEMERSNNLYVLSTRIMEVIGKIEKLAEGETVKSARFMGDTGYFVTYRNIDPLFSVDLSEPESPKLLGELKITGFSQYLHFYGEDKLLGLGWETDPDTGQTLGLKCSMFDLSDPADVKETDKLILGDVSYCDALNQYKSILADPEKNVFGFAYAVYDDAGYGERYYYGVLSYSENGFLPLAYIQTGKNMADSYEDYSSLRGLYIGDTFYLAGNQGVEAFDMNNDFEKTGSIYWESGEK